MDGSKHSGVKIVLSEPYRVTLIADRQDGWLSALVWARKNSIQLEFKAMFAPFKLVFSGVKAVQNQNSWADACKMNDGELSEMEKMGHPRGGAVVLDGSTKQLTSVSKARKKVSRPDWELLKDRREKEKAGSKRPGCVYDHFHDDSQHVQSVHR